MVVDIPDFQNFDLLETVFAIGQNLVVYHSKNAKFSPIQELSVLGKPTEYRNMMACPVPILSGLN